MDVIQYWERIAKACGDPRSWNDLGPEQQNMLIESVNILFFVLNSR